MNRRPTLASIDRKLSKAAQLLDGAAADLRDADLDPRQNIRKIGSALVSIFEIQHQIYRRDPTLAPASVADGLGIARARPRGAKKEGPTRTRRQSEATRKRKS